MCVWIQSIQELCIWSQLEFVRVYGDLDADSARLWNITT